MTLSLKDVRSWTVEEYHRMAQVGILVPEEGPTALANALAKALEIPAGSDTE